MDDMAGTPQTVRLSNATLEALPEDVLRPEYDRSALTPGIVHIGLGNFHRAHQAWYLHRLMQQGLAQDWAIIGAGVRPYDEAQRQKMAAQDFLTTLIMLDPEETSVEVTGSMWSELQQAALAAKADPVVWLKQRQLYGDLADNGDFVSRFSRSLSMIWEQGTEAVLADYLSG